MNKNKDYLITEKPSRALFAFALPMIIGNLFQQAYTIVDSAIVGHYVGETALAAVGASYALTSIFICVAIGGGIGASVIISQHFGGHAYSRMKNSIRTAMLSFLLISLLLGGIGLCFSRQIMETLNTPADAMDMEENSALLNQVSAFPSNRRSVRRKMRKEQTAEMPWAIKVA